MDGFCGHGTTEQGSTQLQQKPRRQKQARMSYLLLYNYGCTNALCHQNIYVSLKAFLSSDSICQSRKTRSVRVVRNFYQRHPPPKASICSRGLSTEASSSNHGESSDTHAKSHRRPTQHTRRDTGPYAFPTHANPTPYEIFHLPVGATQNAIKGRCKLRLSGFLWLSF